MEGEEEGQRKTGNKGRPGLKATHASAANISTRCRPRSLLARLIQFLLMKSKAPDPLPRRNTTSAGTHAAKLHGLDENHKFWALWQWSEDQVVAALGMKHCGSGLSRCSLCCLSSWPVHPEQRCPAYRFFLPSIQCQMQNSCIYYRFTSVTGIWSSVSTFRWPQNRHINHQRSRICLSYWLCNWKLHDSFVQFYKDTMSIFHTDINIWNMIPFLNSLFHKSIRGFLPIIF